MRKGALYGIILVETPKQGSHRGHCMQIIDQSNTIKYICKIARQNNEAENCAVAFARKEGSSYVVLDHCMVENLGGKTTCNLSIIPRKVSLALIKVCIKEKLVPLIIHTHLFLDNDEYVCFSETDKDFITHFANAAFSMGHCSTCLFLVTDGRSARVCEKNSV